MGSSNAPPAKRDIKRVFIRGSIEFCAASVLVAVLIYITLNRGASFSDLTIEVKEGG